MYCARSGLSGYLPLLREQQLVGTFEIVGFTEPLTETALQSLDGLAELAVIALGSAEQYEEQRQNLLDSIHRLTQLYDLEKSLNETLDFEPLLELIPVKVAAMLPCQAIHLWMFDGGRLRLVSAWSGRNRRGRRHGGGRRGLRRRYGGRRCAAVDQRL